MSDTSLAEAERSLVRIQSFKSEDLPRVNVLGSEMNFVDAIEPADRIIGLFSQIPRQFLREIPENKLNDLKSHADGAYSIFEDILRFDPKTNAYGERTALINSLKSQYEPLFNALSPLIAFTSSRLRDFGAIERDARAAVQAAKDQAADAMEQLQAQRDEAERILTEVRRVAEEHGVSQQAMYFDAEGRRHIDEAATWQKVTVGIAIGLGGYSALSLFLHKIPWLSPVDTYTAFQLGLSKVLIFGVIAYMLLLSARNFLAHKHNAVVNRHRYNALLTFTVLADAAKGSESRDIVLTHAASCIFSPQETGYTKGGSQPESAANVIQTLPRLFSSSSAPSG